MAAWSSGIFENLSRRTVTLIPTIIAIISAIMVTTGFQIEAKTVLAQKTATGLAVVGFLGLSICFAMYSWTFLKASGSVLMDDRNSQFLSIRGQKINDSSSSHDILERIKKIESALNSINAVSDIDLGSGPIDVRGAI